MLLGRGELFFFLLLLICCCWFSFSLFVFCLCFRFVLVSFFLFVLLLSFAVVAMYWCVEVVVGAPFSVFRGLRWSRLRLLSSMSLILDKKGTKGMGWGIINRRAKINKSERLTSSSRAHLSIQFAFYAPVPSAQSHCVLFWSQHLSVFLFFKGI